MNTNLFSFDSLFQRTNGSLDQIPIIFWIAIFAFLFVTFIMWCFLPWILLGQSRRIYSIELKVAYIVGEMGSAHGTLIAIERNTCRAIAPLIPEPVKPAASPANPFRP